MKDVKISLFFLFVIALIGTLMRASAYVDLPLNVGHLIHAHSHVAFQGWIYTIMLLLVPHLFLTEEQIKKGRYALQFKITIPIIFAILISFSVQGYALYSIAFSTLFQVMNYWLIFRFFKDTRNSKSAKQKDVSLRFVRLGFWLGLLSTIAPLAIGVLSAKGLAGTEAYSAGIYFFLHFQYNGWFLFVALGLLFKYFEREGLAFNKKQASQFFQLLALAAVPAYALSLLGMSFRDYVLAPAAVATLLQFLGLIAFWKIILKINLKIFTEKSLWVKLFWGAAFASFSLKIGLQLLSVFPLFESYAFDSRNLIMAYMHLCLIGLISFFLIGMILQLGWLKTNRWTRTGSALLLGGFVGSELVLVMSGLAWVQLPMLLLVLSAAMAAGILLLLLGGLGRK